LKAMVLKRIAPIDENPLEYSDLEKPSPSKGEVLLKVKACGVCRTDLHIIEGELKTVKLPLIPGHQVIGVVEDVGEEVNVEKGIRVGVPWLYWACGECKYCRLGLENLCDKALFTGYHVDGGYAEYMIAKADFIHPIPDVYDDYHAAPLLCGGAIGYRALRLTGLLERGEGRLGLFGFGSSAHMILQVAVNRGLEVYVFTRSKSKQEYAIELGAKWAGHTRDEPPHKLDSAIVFAPASWVFIEALKKVDKGGRVVLAEIYMTPIEKLDYSLLWLEREIKSVANVTRRDVSEFLIDAAKAGVKPYVTLYDLKDANKALYELKYGEAKGSAVLKI